MAPRPQYSAKIHPAAEDDFPTTSGGGKSFPFSSEAQRASAMKSLAEHNANLAKFNNSPITETPFSVWNMSGKKVLKGTDLMKRNGASSSGIPNPPQRVATQSAITNLFTTD
jgi:hypothetical protein